MKIKKLLIPILVAAIAFSCKDAGEKNKENEATSEAKMTTIKLL
jgi:hypothetical protein